MALKKDKRLDEARQEIQEIDEKMRSLFVQRMKAAEQVAAFKKDYGLAIHVPEREEENIKRQSEQLEDPNLVGFYAEYMRETMRVSRSYQEQIISGMRVAYSGIEGAYANIATKHLFPSAKKISYSNFKDAYDAVMETEADIAVLPLENSSAGEVGQVSDLIFSGPLYVNGTYELTIQHDLLGCEGSELEDIDTVISHPQALAQCADFIKKHGFKQEACENTAVAAAQVAKKKEKNVAAIASKEMAALYPLKTLSSSINSSYNNTTRFAILSPKLNVVETKQNDVQFILMFTVKNEAGSLARALNIIGSHGFNLRVLRSRPMKELLWQYYFYVEAEGNVHTAEGRDMMEALQITCNHLKLVGSFQTEYRD